MIAALYVETGGAREESGTKGAVLMLVQSGYQEPPFSLWRWLGFGEAHVSGPMTDEEEAESEAKGFTAGALVTVAYTRFDWGDRLRVLVSGKVMLYTRTETDVIVRKSRSRSSASVLPPNHHLRP